MLSNTATPKYYALFRDKVLSGELPVCETIKMQMNRIEDRIRNPGMYYDLDAVEGWIKFNDTEATLTDGSDFHTLDTFKLWGEDLFGWYYFSKLEVWEPGRDGRGGRYVVKWVKKRLTQIQYLIVPRANAKSMYMSRIQDYFLNIDPSTTHQITTAPTMKQSNEVINPISVAITRARGPYFKLLTSETFRIASGIKSMTPILATTKKGIENKITGSYLEVRPMSIEKLQGLGTKCNTVDEWLSCDIRENPINTIWMGCQKVNDPVIVAASSEGTVRGGPGDDIKIELMKTLKGEFIQNHVSIWWYKMDDINEIAHTDPLTNKTVYTPELWIKACPNLGKTVSYETYQLDVERAENVPSDRNDILAKRFSIPMEGTTYFFTYQETLPAVYPDGTPKKFSFKHMPCTMGADLSQGDDFCSFTFLFPLQDGCFGIKTINYISASTYSKIRGAMKEKYREFIKEGTLVVLEGVILNLDDVYDDLDRHIIANDYDVRTFGFDPYHAEGFVNRWTSENGSFGVEKVIQGVKTESVPLGELKKLAQDRKLLFDEQIMKFAMGNCITLEDTNGNRKLWKVRREAKIDCVAAMMDGLVAYERNMEAFD